MTQEHKPASEPRTTEQLRARIITGVSAVAFGLMVFIIGSPMVQFAGMAIAVAIAYEWHGLVRKSSTPSVAGALMIAGVGFGTFASGHGAFVLAGVGMIVACVLTALAAWNSPRDRVWLPLGIIYAGVPWSLLIWLFVMGGVGPWILFIGLSLVINADIAAYFAGKHLGGPLLAPKISPKKTWIGLLMGVAAGYVVAQVMVTWSPVTSWKFALAAPFFAALSQVSDLLESRLKRHFGVKDAGTLLPGHGGVMDRMDGMTLTSVALVLFCVMGWH